MENGLSLLGQLPHDRAVTDAMVAAETITEHQQNGISDQVRQVWSNIEATATVHTAA
jgi:hypothetical protein